MLKMEERPCCECAHFKPRIGGFPTCRKKLMGITANMLVTYKESAGTCFEAKEAGK